MNLAQRRHVEDFQTNHFPSLKSKVDQAAGFEVPVEVHWDSLAVPGEENNYAQCWPAVCFEPLTAALQDLVSTEMGRDAVKAGLKKVVLQNTKDCSYGDCWASFKGAVLTLDHLSTTNSYAKDERKNSVVKVLEQNL